MQSGTQKYFASVILLPTMLYVHILYLSSFSFFTSIFYLFTLFSEKQLWSTDKVYYNIITIYIIQYSHELNLHVNAQLWVLHHVFLHYSLWFCRNFHYFIDDWQTLTKTLINEERSLLICLSCFPIWCWAEFWFKALQGPQFGSWSWALPPFLPKQKHKQMSLIHCHLFKFIVFYFYSRTCKGVSTLFCDKFIDMSIDIVAWQKCRSSRCSHIIDMSFNLLRKFIIIVLVSICSCVVSSARVLST